MGDIKNYVQQWRDIKEQIRQATEQKDKAQREVQEADAKYVAQVSQCDEQKADKRNVLRQIEATVNEERDKANSATKEADELMAKAIEKRSRNEEYQKKLSGHFENLQSARDQIDQRDSEAQRNLIAFRVERERCKIQLEEAIRTLKATIPKEREETAKKIAEASQRKEDARKQLEADKKRWAMLISSRKRERHAEMMEAVEEEHAAAKESRKEARKLKSQVETTLAVDKELLKKIRKLKSDVAGVIHSANNFENRQSSEEEEQQQQQYQGESFILSSDSAVPCS